MRSITGKRAASISVRSCTIRHLPSRISRRCTTKQDHGLDEALDYQLIDHARKAIDRHQPMEITLPIRNIHRTVGAMLSGEIARKLGAEGLPDNTIEIQIHTGSARARSFRGLSRSPASRWNWKGDSNDYVGKEAFPAAALLSIRTEGCARSFRRKTFWSATWSCSRSAHHQREAFIFNGMAGERFAVR